jgi:hypothetical protein
MEIRKTGRGSMKFPSMTPRLCVSARNSGLRLIFGNHPALDLLYLGMVGERINMAITGAEEAAQDPADDADHDAGEESTPESLDVKTRDHGRDKEQEEGIDHQDKEPHGDDDKGEAQEE